MTSNTHTDYAVDSIDGMIRDGYAACGGYTDAGFFACALTIEDHDREFTEDLPESDRKLRLLPQKDIDGWEDLSIGLPRKLVVRWIHTGSSASVISSTSETSTAETPATGNPAADSRDRESPDQVIAEAERIYGPVVPTVETMDWESKKRKIRKRESGKGVLPAPTVVWTELTEGDWRLMS
jgi:hypothetical protein